MSIGNFISSALILLEYKKYDAALSLISSAVDATARKMCPDEKNNNVRFKEFLKRNMRVITFRGFPGILASGIRIKCTNINILKTDKEGSVGIEDIIYQVIRCGLIHECEIYSRIEFTEETYIGNFDRKFKIPKDLVYGLALAVILSEHNIHEKVEENVTIPMFGENQKVNSLWGKLKELSKNL